MTPRALAHTAVVRWLLLRVLTSFLILLRHGSAAVSELLRIAGAAILQTCRPSSLSQRLDITVRTSSACRQYGPTCAPPSNTESCAGCS